MEYYDVSLFYTLIDNKIKDSHISVLKFNGYNSSKYMITVSENIDEIYREFSIYIVSNYRSKNKSYCNAIKFMLNYYNKVSYKKTKSNTNSRRKVFYSMLKELTDIYIYNPCAERIQKKMFEQAQEYVDNRDTKRLKLE
jgi:hypothetical protein